MTGRGHRRRRESADAQAEPDRALIDHSFRKKRKGVGVGGWGRVNGGKRGHTG